MPTRSSRLAGAARVAAVAAAACVTSVAQAARDATYTGAVARIVERHCIACHGPGAGPVSGSLASYEDLRARATEVLSAVERGAMPPWPLDPSRSLPMRNDPRLSAAETDALRAWVARGMPRGDGVPRQISPAGEWADPRHRPPDAVVALPPIPVPATGELPYMQVLIKVPFADDRWIGALQPLAGNLSVVHHMGIAEVHMPPGVGVQTVHDLQDVARRLGLAGVPLATPAVVDASFSGDYDMLAAYTPGGGFESYPEDTGKLLKGGEGYYISFNVHYTTNGTATTDQSRLGLWFRKSPPARQIFRTPSAGRTILAQGRLLFPDDPGSKAEGMDVAIPPIPPNDDNYEIIGITAYDRPVTLYSLQPHAHLRAKDFRYDVIYPDGALRTLLAIPRYDYHWQLNYLFATPLDVPAGAKLVVTAHYDNSAANKHLREYSSSNPAARCGPDRYAYFRSQNQTWDEMFSPLVQYAALPRPVEPVAARAPLQMIAVQGCLVPAGESGWALRRALPLGASKTAAITREELGKMMISRGEASYRLIGLDPLNPQSSRGRTVLVKGLGLPGTPTESINVTAIYPIAETCEP